MKNAHKVKIGIQGSVIAWDDPWNPALCEKYLRTGEGKHFPSQDTTPSIKAFIEFIKQLGVDFYLHHVMPQDSEVSNFIESINSFELEFFLGTEYGNINKPAGSLNNRYDIPENCVEKAHNTGKFLGIVYDETEHLQLHPDIYLSSQLHHDKGIIAPHQWTSTQGKTLEEMDQGVCDAVRERRTSYGKDTELFSEQVFPVMFHTLARGGMNPCPKVMKEEFQSIQLATALGAAKQYSRKMGICADLWGPDVGSWFTRLWGFPGHSPREFKAALEMAYMMGPDYLFVENIDPLAIHKPEGFLKSEFGDIFESFIKDFVLHHPLPYEHLMAEADIAIIRSDDTDWSIYGGFSGRGLFGSLEVKGDFKSRSVFDVFHLISHGKTPKQGISFFLPEYDYPSARYQRNEETLKKLPLYHGVHEKNLTHVHPLFFPMRNVLVFDEYVDSATLGNPELIFLAGSRASDTLLCTIHKQVVDGTVCIAASWLVPHLKNGVHREGKGLWVVVDDFGDPIAYEHAHKHMGRNDCWQQRFGSHEIRFYDPQHDGVSLCFERT